MNYFEEHKTAIVVASCSIIAFILLGILIFKDSLPHDEKKYIPDNTFNKDYKIDDMIPVYVDYNTIAKTYLAEFVSLVNTNPKKAYEILDSVVIKDKFDTYEKFKDYADRYFKMNTFQAATVTKFDVQTVGGIRYVFVIDKGGNKITFVEKSIRNYTVQIG